MPLRSCARSSKAAPEAVIHQLTDWPFAPDDPRYKEGLARNARLRIEGTRNLVAAAQAAKVGRMVAQSIAFIYAPGPGARVETDPLNSDSAAARTVEAVSALEAAVLSMPEGLVLRYGYLYGPGTWSLDTAAFARFACRCRRAGRVACAHARRARHLQCRRGRADAVERKSQA